MIAGDELVPQLALAAVADGRPQIERGERRRGMSAADAPAARCRVRTPWPARRARPLRRRQLDQPVLVHGQHGHPGHHVLEAAVGFEPADAPAELPGQRMAVGRRVGGDQRAQQRHFLRREVAPVIPALGAARHPGAIRASLRSSLIDQGSHAERSSGGRPPFSAQASSHAPSQRRTSTRLVFSVATTEYISAVNRAPVLLSEPNESRLPMTGAPERPFRGVIVHGNQRPVDEDTQSAAVVEQ